MRHTTAPSALRRSLLLRGTGLLAATAAPAWLTPALAQGTALRPTPSQSEGPFYPVTLPDRQRLRPAAQRQRSTTARASRPGWKAW